MSRPRVPARFVVLVTGARNWTDHEALFRRLRAYPPGTLLIHGGAISGADQMAHKFVPHLGFREIREIYFSDLDRAGGPARNALLVDIAAAYARHGYTVAVEAFPTAQSRGTWNCVNLAKAAGLAVEVTRG